MIEEWKKLEEAATPGPWKVRTLRSDCFVEGNKVVGKTVAGDYKQEILSDGDYDEKKHDAELITLLRNHSKELRDVVEAAKEVDRIGGGVHLQLHEALAALEAE